MLEQLKQYEPMSIMLIAAFIFLDITTWNTILNREAIPVAHAYFLNVSQGDAELIIFPGNIKILIDMGYDTSIVNTLEEVMPKDDSYIDLLLISEPSSGTTGGLSAVLEHYSVGTLLDNGHLLNSPLSAKNIPAITLGAGDNVHIMNHEGDLINILSPDDLFDHGPSAPDADLVETVQTKYWKALFMANAPAETERWLLKKNYKNIKADILKVSTHGSKYSSTASFLRDVNPKIAVIETAAKGIGGKASQDVLDRLAQNTSGTVLQTGKIGIIDVRYDTIRKTLIYGP